MRRPITFFVLLCILSFTLLACSGQDQTPNSSTTNTQAAGSSSTASSTPSKVSTKQSTSSKQISTTSSYVQPTKIESNLSATVVSFYQALESKNYSKAYTYVSSSATTAGQKLTETTFTQMAQAADSTSGAISNFSFIADSTNYNRIITTVTRKTGAHYHSHLQFQQENATWKLVQIDII